MVNKIFDKIVFSNIPPSNTNVLWIYPIDSKHYDIRMYSTVQQNEYTSIKKWTSIGITDIAKTELSTDFWYVGFLEKIPTFDLKVINNNSVQRNEEYNTEIEDMPIIDRLLVSYVFDDLDRKNLYFDTRQIDPEKDLDKYYTVVIPDYYKINSIIKENYYEGDKVYQKDVLAEGEYLLSSTLDFNGKQYTLLTLKFYDELTPFQITTNVVRDLEIKDFIVQERGYSIERVMSQNIVTKLIEDLETNMFNLNVDMEKVLNTVNFIRDNTTILPERDENTEGFLHIDKEGNMSWSQNNNAGVIKETITVAGGPLADDVSDNWPTDWVDPNDSSLKIIPAGTPLETVISRLFAQIVDGTVSWGNIVWNPTMKNPTISLNKSNTVEVGTVAIITSSPTTELNNNVRQSTLQWNPASNGYFDGDTWSNNPKIVEINGNNPTGTLSLTLTLKIGSNTTTITSDRFTVGEGTNTVTATQTGYTVTSGTLPSTTVYASNNTKQKLTDASKGQVAILNDTAVTTKTLEATSATASVTGARFIFWGADNGTNIFDSEYIRTNKKGSAANPNSSTGEKMNVSSVTRLWVAIPSGSSKKVNNIYGANGSDMGSYINSNPQTIQNVPVYGANNYSPANYTVYTFNSNSPLTEEITVIIK